MGIQMMILITLSVMFVMTITYLVIFQEPE